MEEGEESQYLTSFCRIIMPSVVGEHRLVLPKKFVDGYGDDLSNTITLELPGVVVGGDTINTCWRIGLRYSGGLLFLEDGFQEFMQWFSVGFGKVLLFKYRGNSVFNLHIFDLTAMEIDYGHGFDTSPQRPLPIDDARNVKKEIHDESASDALVVHTTIREDADLADTTPRKKQKGSVELGLAESTPRTRRKQKGILARRRSRRLSERHSVEEAGGNQEQGRARALSEAKKYKTHNPFCIVRIKKYTIAYNMMHLPTKFCEDNKNDLLGECVDLLDPYDDRSWRVRCSVDRFRFNLGKGLSQFIKDKELLGGDVCVFEILCKGILKVSVFSAK